MADLRCTIAGITSPNPFWLEIEEHTSELQSL